MQPALRRIWCIFVRCDVIFEFQKNEPSLGGLLL
jgi:hypothetical protein